MNFQFTALWMSSIAATAVYLFGCGTANQSATSVPRNSANAVEKQSLCLHADHCHDEQPTLVVRDSVVTSDNAEREEYGSDEPADDIRSPGNDDPADDLNPDPETPNPVEDPEDPVVDTGPRLIEFKILAGTGNGAWNTEATMVTAKIGDTVRLINEDNIEHRMHTSGAPCPHGDPIAPGAFVDCEITRTIDPTGQARPATYDHGAGNAASFWIKATE